LLGFARRDVPDFARATGCALVRESFLVGLGVASRMTGAGGSATGSTCGTGSTLTVGIGGMATGAGSGTVTGGRLGSDPAEVSSSTGPLRVPSQ
jgi:hypothetical protein